MTRDMTKAEAQWWQELKVLLRKQPRNVELHARHGGSIGIAPIGACRDCLEQKGDSDALCDTEWDSVGVRGLDGRDSQL